VRRVQVHVDLWRRSLLALCINQLHLFETRHPHRGDDIVLKLRETHAKTRVPADAPSDPAVLLILVFRAAGQVSFRVETIGVGVSVWISVDVGNVQCGVAVCRNDLGALLVHGDGSTGRVLAESGAGELQSNSLFEHEVEGREFGFPRFHGNVHKAIDEWERSISAMAIGGGLDFFSDQLMPVIVVSQIKQHPRSVDSRVELACEERTEHELVGDCQFGRRTMRASQETPTVMILVTSSP
jgi:hypothetical protein